MSAVEDLIRIELLSAVSRTAALYNGCDAFRREAVLRFLRGAVCRMVITFASLTASTLRFDINVMEDAGT